VDVVLDKKVEEMLKIDDFVNVWKKEASVNDSSDGWD